MSGKYTVMAGWDDVPHLTQEQKDRLYAEIPPYQRDARAKGIPQLGAGAIYPVAESEFVIPPFQLPDHYPRCYGLDVGWNRTAAIHLAHDREADTVYAYAEHYMGNEKPPVHAAAIRAKGDWIPGVTDPAARGRQQRDGERLMQDYIDLGLNVQAAFNGVEAGLLEVLMRISTGRLKVFSTLVNWLAEFRLYRRDEKGHVVKQNDHAMDATRYGVVSGLAIACIKPPNQWAVNRNQPQLQSAYDPAAALYGNNRG